MADRGLFRWAGAKRHLIEKVQPMVAAHRNSTDGNLISLFFGSGAIERACQGCTVAADASPELLQLYSELQQHRPEDVHQALVTFDAKTPRTPEAYKAVGRNPTNEPMLSSARFLWLSAMAYNGVWRVNSRGEMNMGVDRARLARADVLPPLEAFQLFAQQIRGIEFVRGYEKALERARAGDVVFVDPPYGEFDQYTAAGFSAKDHRLLAGALHDAADRGVAVIAFNEPNAVSLYGHWAKCETVTRSGCVSSKASARDPVSELVITAGLKGLQP